MKTIKFETVFKYLFITFIIVISVMMLVDGFITNDSWLMGS